MATKVLIVDDHPAIREGLAGHIASHATWRSVGRPRIQPRPCDSWIAIAPTWLSWTSNWRPAAGWNSSRGSMPAIIDRDSRLVDVLRCDLCPAAWCGALGYINKRQASSRIVGGHSPGSRRQDLPLRGDR